MLENAILLGKLSHEDRTVFLVIVPTTKKADLRLLRKFRHGCTRTQVFMSQQQPLDEIEGLGRASW